MTAYLVKRNGKYSCQDYEFTDKEHAIESVLENLKRSGVIQRIILDDLDAKKVTIIEKE